MAAESTSADGERLDALLDGRVTEGPLGMLLAAAAAPGRADELRGLPAALTAYRAAFAPAAPVATSRLRMLAGRHPRRAVTIAALVAGLSGVTSAAATGTLPTPVQSVAHDVLPAIAEPTHAQRSAAAAHRATHSSGTEAAGPAAACAPRPAPTSGSVRPSAPASATPSGSVTSGPLVVTTPSPSAESCDDRDRGGSGPRTTSATPSGTPAPHRPATPEPGDDHGHHGPQPTDAVSGAPTAQPGAGGDGFGGGPGSGSGSGSSGTGGAGTGSSGDGLGAGSGADPGGFGSGSGRPGASTGSGSTGPGPGVGSGSDDIGDSSGHRRGGPTAQPTAATTARAVANASAPATATPTARVTPAPTGDDHDGGGLGRR